MNKPLREEFFAFCLNRSLCDVKIASDLDVLAHFQVQMSISWFVRITEVTYSVRNYLLLKQ